MIIAAIKAFNKWYDGLQEPFRFLTALVLCMAGIVAMTFGNHVAEYLGAAWLVLLLFTRVYNSLNEKG